MFFAMSWSILTYWGSVPKGNFAQRGISGLAEGIDGAVGGTSAQQLVDRSGLGHREDFKRIFIQNDEGKRSWQIMASCFFSCIKRYYCLLYGRTWYDVSYMIWIVDILAILCFYGEFLRLEGPTDPQRSSRVQWSDHSLDSPQRVLFSSTKHRWMEFNSLNLQSFDEFDSATAVWKNMSPENAPFIFQRIFSQNKACNTGSLHPLLGKPKHGPVWKLQSWDVWKLSRWMRLDALLDSVVSCFF